ncbi:MAG: hypothetical protein LBT01_09415 [Spirochaetaceae bacterium]|jgi:hypothetical protein|nr:hypothetical protein [Spirochaetaceae bacterium]
MVDFGYKGKVFSVLALCAVLSLASCASRYNFAVGLSDELAQYYGIYPSLEADLALVIDSEADSIKAAGVDTYFEPGNSIRQKLVPWTMFFSDESIETARLVEYDDHWFAWLEKNPTQFLLIVNLPPVAPAAAPPAGAAPPPAPSDPRMILVPMDKNFFIQDAFFKIEPAKISKVNVAPETPKPENKGK